MVEYFGDFSDLEKDVWYFCVITNIGGVTKKYAQKMGDGYEI